MLAASSITLELVGAGEVPDLSVLQLDAHADMRKITGRVQTTPAWPADLRALPVVQVGIRSLSVEDF
jgi:arginase family enzyme